MHPLEKFEYCPVCGSRHFENHDAKSRKCGNCGFEYYLNPSASTAAFILNERDELLVLTRSQDPGKGTLDLPGGFCDIGETAEQGIIREVKEETGLTVDATEYLFSYPNVYIYSDFEVKTLDLFFVCHVSDFSTLVARDDAKAYQWIPLRDIRTELFGMRSIRQALISYRESRTDL